MEPPAPASTIVPLVIVIVPFLDAAATLPACLDSLRGQRGAPPHEVLLVDNGSRDGSRAIAETMPGALVIEERAPGCGPARNAALRRSRAPLVAMLDADCVAPPDWLARLVAAIDLEPGAAALGGSLSNLSPRHLVAHALHLFEFGEQWPRRAPARDTPHAVPGNIVYRRAAIEAEGGFSERLSGAAEDTHLHVRLRRAGGRVLLDPRIAVTHATTRDLWRALRKVHHLGRGFVMARRLDAGMPLAWLARSRAAIALLAAPGRVATTLAKTARAGALDLWAMAAMPIVIGLSIAFAVGALREASKGDATESQRL